MRDQIGSFSILLFRVKDCDQPALATCLNLESQPHTLRLPFAENHEITKARTSS